MKKNYVGGIIGAIIGGLVGCIPWIIAYVYLNIIFALLAIVVAYGALYGYKLFKGTEDKKLPIIILVISLLAITISTLVIIPALLLGKEGFEMSIDNLKILYQQKDFTAAIFKDYAISIIFTLLGIGGTIAAIKKQVSPEPSIVKPNSEQQLDNDTNKNQL